MKQNSKIFLAIVALSLGVFCLPAVHAYEIFMKIDGVPGEATKENRKDWIEVFSFSHVITNASGTSLSKPGHADLTVGKRVDRTTPRVNFQLNRAEPVPVITLEFEQGGEPARVFYKVVMENVRIMRAETKGSTFSDDVVYESLSLKYDKITWTYTSYDAKGIPTSTTSTWDVLANKGS